MNPKQKNKLLKQYPLEVLINVIHEMGEFIIDETRDEQELPTTILQALTIGCAIINDSELDIEQIGINNYTIGIS